MDWICPTGQRWCHILLKYTDLLLKCLIIYKNFAQIKVLAKPFTLNVYHSTLIFNCQCPKYQMFNMKDICKYKGEITCPGERLARVKCMKMRIFSLFPMIPACPTGNTFGATGGMVRHSDMLHLRLFCTTSSGWTSKRMSWMMFLSVSGGQCSRRQKPTMVLGR